MESKGIITNEKMLYKKIIVSAILVFSICIGIFPIMSFESFSLDSLVAQDYYESRLSGIAYVADSNFNSYNMKSISEVEKAPTSVKLGEASECGTTALLGD